MGRARRPTIPPASTHSSAAKPVSPIRLGVGIHFLAIKQAIRIPVASTPFLVMGREMPQQVTRTRCSGIRQVQSRPAAATHFLVRLLQNTGRGNASGSNNTAIGTGADFNLSNLDHATAIGAGTVALASNQVQIGRGGIDKVSIGLLGSAAATQICMVNSTFSTCSSSRRYKENIEPFGAGFSLLQRLRPVTFDWKDRKEHDLGLIAEEVFDVEPLLVTHNDKGEIEGVKYDKLTIVLINALKDQQERIEDQRRQIENLNLRQDEFDSLKRLVCADHPTAAVCVEH
jgi:hypothetical protein